MKPFFCVAVLFWLIPGLAAQGVDANSITVNSNRFVAIDFDIAVAQFAVSTDAVARYEDVLAAFAELGGTPELVASFQQPAARPELARVLYNFRLIVPIAKMTELRAGLDRLRRTLDPKFELQPFPQINPAASAEAIDNARAKGIPDALADARRRAQAYATPASLTLGPISGLIEQSLPQAPFTGNVIGFPITVRFSTTPRP